MKLRVIGILTGLSLAFVPFENAKSLDGASLAGYSWYDQERQDEKVKIKKEELPEAARKALEGDAFKGWTVVAAYRTRDGEYEVEMKKGDTTQAIKFDKNGKVK